MYIVGLLALAILLLAQDCVVMVQPCRLRMVLAFSNMGWPQIWVMELQGQFVTTWSVLSRDLL